MHIHDDNYNRQLKTINLIILPPVSDITVTLTFGLSLILSAITHFTTVNKQYCLFLETRRIRHKILLHFEQR